MATPGRHAGPSAPQRDAVAEPSLAERARTLMHLGRIGSLSTHSRKQPGYPFGSVMPYSADHAGRPVFLISHMAMHTQNLHSDAHASLLVMEPAEGEPLGAARVTLMGEVLPVAGNKTSAVRELYLSRYDGARQWVDFEDFGFYRMQPVDIYFIGGFGVMGWVTAGEYLQAAPDPLAESAAGILRHMNQDHSDSLLLLARSAGEKDAELAFMTAVDRLGFHVRLRSGDRVYGARIGFPQEVRTAAEVRATLIAMVKDSRVTQSKLAQSS
jgi:putative heme iron utilization protein